MRLILIEILFKTQLQLCINVNTNSKHLKVKKIADYINSLQDVYI